MNTYTTQVMAILVGEEYIEELAWELIQELENDLRKAANESGPILYGWSM